MDTSDDEHNALQATRWSTIVSGQGRALGKSFSITMQTQSLIYLFYPSVYCGLGHKGHMPLMKLKIICFCPL